MIPRRNNLWAFGGSRDDFVDNAKYLYLWVSLNRPDIEAIWITGRKSVYQDLHKHGYKVVYRWSLAGIYTALRARLHIFDFRARYVHVIFSGGSLHINLWHGVGIKNCEFAAKIGPTANFFSQRYSPLARLKNWDCFRKPDIVLSTSPLMSQHFARCFLVPVEHCPQLGYPRLDIAFDVNLKKSSLLFGDYSFLIDSFKNYEEVYIYVPTYRDSEDYGPSRDDFLLKAFPNFQALSTVLLKRKAILYIKLHPGQERTVLPSEIYNIRAWPSGIDIQPVLADFDLLITDYSSILYDYIFLRNSGVVLYTFDYEQYIEKDRDLAFPFEENTIGLRLSNFDDLCHAIDTGAAIEPLPIKKLDELRKRFWGKCMPIAASEIVSYLSETKNFK